MSIPGIWYAKTFNLYSIMCRFECSCSPRLLLPLLLLHYILIKSQDEPPPPTYDNILLCGCCWSTLHVGYIIVYANRISNLERECSQAVGRQLYRQEIARVCPTSKERSAQVGAAPHPPIQLLNKLLIRPISSLLDVIRLDADPGDCDNHPP